jgi:hypothetical protein
MSLQSFFNRETPSRSPADYGGCKRRRPPPPTATEGSRSSKACSITQGRPQGPCLTKSQSQFPAFPPVQQVLNNRMFHPGRPHRPGDSKSHSAAVKAHKYSTVKLNLTLGALPPVQPINEAPDHEIHHHTEAEPDPSRQIEEQALSPFPQPAAIEEG